MKLIAYLIITASVIAGSLASSTAYLTPLDLPAERLSELTLNSPAGKYDPTDPEEATTAFLVRLAEVREKIAASTEETERDPLKPEQPVREAPDVPEVEIAPPGEAELAAREAVEPIGRKGDKLIPELVELLRDEGVQYVKTSSFSFGTWPHWWLFVLACLGLGGGALLVRNAQKTEIARANALQVGTPEDAADAKTVFARLSGRLDELSKDLARATTEDEQLDAIVRRVGNIQRDDVPAFIADRPALVSRMGLAGYAELMDHFAAMERQLNRAWSAAADGHLPEAESCLAAAQPMLLQTLQKLKG
jgi:hypothetical protein